MVNFWKARSIHLVVETQLMKFPRYWLRSPKYRDIDGEITTNNRDRSSNCLWKLQGFNTESHSIFLTFLWWNSLCLSYLGWLSPVWARLKIRYPYIPLVNSIFRHPQRKGFWYVCYPITFLIYPRISNTRNMYEILHTMFVYFYPITFHIDSRNYF